MSLKMVYLICLILAAIGLLFLFYAKIESLFVFFPETRIEQTPNALGLRHEEVHFATEDGEELHGWLFPLEREAPVILFCHGNAGNMSHRLENIELLLSQQLGVFIFDYRGYGMSSGKPSERGLYLDGVAAYDYLSQENHISPVRIIPFGRSLGAAVALEISLRRRVSSIIIEGAFTSTREIAGSMPLFRLISPFLPAHYNNLQKIGSVHVPKLIIHAERDEIVPFWMGRKLFEVAKDPKDFLPVVNAGHNDTFIAGGQEYLEAIAAFAYHTGT